MLNAIIQSNFSSVILYKHQTITSALLKILILFYHISITKNKLQKSYFVSKNSTIQEGFSIIKKIWNATKNIFEVPCSKIVQQFSSVSILYPEINTQRQQRKRWWRQCLNSFKTSTLKRRFGRIPLSHVQLS